jgi:hypothetical protein
MPAFLVIALTLIFGLAVAIIWHAVTLAADILLETLQYIFRFEER